MTTAPLSAQAAEPGSAAGAAVVARGLDETAPFTPAPDTPQTQKNSRKISSKKSSNLNFDQGLVMRFDGIFANSIAHHRPGIIFFREENFQRFHTSFR